MIWEMAGIVGVHPNPFSMRQLAKMAEGKEREKWGHTAELLAVVANLMARKPIPSWRFNPFRRRRRRQPPVEKMSPKESFNNIARAFLRV